MYPAWKTGLRQLARVLAVAVLSGCGAESPVAIGPTGPAAMPGPPAPEAAVRWVRENAVPLSPAGPVAEELGTFTEAARARLIAFGEATHGTREFFAVRQRFLQYLVENQGFRTLLLEADGGATCELNAYLQTGAGDPVERIHQMKFWTWRTLELLDTVRWLRSYNASVGADRRVSVHGIDMQNPAALAQRVLSFLREADPEAARRAESLYRCLGPLDDREAMVENYRQEDVGHQLQCAAGLAEVRRLLREGQARLERRDPAGYTCALWSADLMISAEVLLRFPGTRDRQYADAVLSLLRAPGVPGGVVLWAHNGHVKNAPGSMGLRLKRQLGDDYIVVGQTFHGGSFRARNLSEDGPSPRAIPIVAPVPFPDSHEAAFQRTGSPMFLLDLRPLRAKAGPGWLGEPHPLWDIGGVYRPKSFNTPARLPEEYDFFVFASQAQASTPLPDAK